MTTNPFLKDLDQQRKRLDYYLQLKEKASLARTGASNKKPAPPSPIDKWVEIYTERVRKLERQASKLGLKTELASSKSAAQRARA